MNTKPTTTSSVCRSAPAWIAAAFVFALGAPAGLAQGRTGETEQPALEAKKLPGLSVTESHFIRKTTKDSDEEIRVSQIAEQRASRPEVKEFAKRVATENGTMNAEIQALASRKNVELPSAAGSGLEKKWNRKDAKEFDNDYLDQVVSETQSLVKTFEKRTDSEDPEVAAYARKALPVLQERLRAARELKGTK